MSAVTTLVGRIVKDPELRFSAAGAAIVAFTIVTSRRVKDQASGEWSDADTTYWDCKAFKQSAENIAESLVKGTAVIAQGRVVQESWEDRQTGAKRSKMVMLVDEIGPSLRSATAKVTRSGGGGQSQQGQGQGGTQFAPGRPQDQGDPWASQAPAGQAAGGWGGASGAGGDEPPF